MIFILFFVFKRDYFLRLFDFKPRPKALANRKKREKKRKKGKERKKKKREKEGKKEKKREKKRKGKKRRKRKEERKKREKKRKKRKRKKKAPSSSLRFHLKPPSTWPCIYIQNPTLLQDHCPKNLVKTLASLALVPLQEKDKMTSVDGQLFQDQLIQEIYTRKK